MVEEQQQNNATNDGYDWYEDIVGSRLQELEDCFGDSTKGCPPLRQLVRSCGMTMLTKLIRNGGLCEETATDLAVPWCHRPYLFDFLQAVQESLVDAQFSPLNLGNGFRGLPKVNETESCPRS